MKGLLHFLSVPLLALCPFFHAALFQLCRPIDICILLFSYFCSMCVHIRLYQILWPTISCPLFLLYANRVFCFCLFLQSDPLLLMLHLLCLFPFHPAFFLSFL